MSRQPRVDMFLGGCDKERKGECRRGIEVGSGLGGGWRWKSVEACYCVNGVFQHHANGYWTGLIPSFPGQASLVLLEAFPRIATTPVLFSFILRSKGAFHGMFVPQKAIVAARLPSAADSSMQLVAHSFCFSSCVFDTLGSRFTLETLDRELRRVEWSCDQNSGHTL